MDMEFKPLRKIENAIPISLSNNRKWMSDGGRKRIQLYLSIRHIVVSPCQIRRF